MALLCVSIDLDEIYCYHRIHGFGEPDKERARVIYRRALPRVARFAEDMGTPCTFFAVGNDLRHTDDAASILKELAGKGHEVASHSMSHRYDFVRLEKSEQAAEIDRCTEAVNNFIGVMPKGFRAPGYTVDSKVLELLSARGYLYDSSVFACPLYYAAKAATIGMSALKGRRSESMLGDPRVLGAPTVPYRVGAEGVWSRGGGMIELPITVVTRARIPMLGTTLSMMGKVPASALARFASRLAFVNIELHAIDFADADGDGIGYLKEHQLELRYPLTKRRAAIERVVSVLLDSGMEPVTLLSAAGRALL